MKITGLLSSILFLCWLTMPTCNRDDRSKRQASFEKDIPVHDTALFRSLGLLRDSLKLDPVDDGFDSLQISVWLNLNYEQQLLVLRYSKGVWGAKLINFGPVLNGKMDSVLSISREVIAKSPRSSWTEIWSRLSGYHILTLPDESSLPGYDAGGDGTHLAFEISTPRKYRLYMYSNPDLNQGIPEARDVVQILSLIQNEFDVDLFVRKKRPTAN